MNFLNVGRILSSMNDATDSKNHNETSPNGDSNKESSSHGALSHFLPTSHRIVQFSNGRVWFSGDLNVLESLCGRISPFWSLRCLL